MKIVVIDGQGGKIGKNLIEMIKRQPTNAHVFAVGTNSIATAVMLRAGADFAATGENPVIVNSRDADFIIGPIGIIAADALYGEITPKMAVAVAQSPALKVLLPINKCKYYIAGVGSLTLNDAVEHAVNYLMSCISSG